MIPVKHSLCQQHPNLAQCNTISLQRGMKTHKGSIMIPENHALCQHHQNCAQSKTISLQRGLNEGATRTKRCPKTMKSSPIHIWCSAWLMLVLEWPSWGLLGHWTRLTVSYRSLGTCSSSLLFLPQACCWEACASKGSWGGAIPAFSTWRTTLGFLPQTSCGA
jgi:hypothetical protein